MAAERAQGLVPVQEPSEPQQLVEAPSHSAISDNPGGTEVSSPELVAEPVVTVMCITFNQADYIGDALDSFLAQETDFPYEVIVNDDCSTDGTTDILLEYQRKNPERVRIVTHEENQWKRGARIWSEFLIPRARGEFLAMCEGDDYWTDPHKLQRQHDALRAHPELAACAHANENVQAATKRRMSVMRYQDHDGVVPVSELVSRVQCFATNTLFFRREAMLDYCDSPFYTLPVDGDQKLTTFFALAGGGIYYIDEVMSAYRFLAKNSINRSMLLSEEREKIAARNHEYRVGLLKAVDEYTDGAHHDDVARGIDQMDYAYHKDLRDWRTLRERWPRQLAAESLPARADLFLYTYCKPLHKLLLGLYYKL